MKQNGMDRKAQVPSKRLIKSSLVPGPSDYIFGLVGKHKNNFKGVTMLIETTGMGPMSLLKIVKLLLGMVEIVWRELRICCTK